MQRIGLRRESLVSERRAPLCPEDLGQVVAQGFAVQVQPSQKRIFDDQEYVEAGAALSADLERCELILALKEVPPEELLAKKVYAYFSHTIKGQPKNMPMLRKLLEIGCTVVDYEKITAANGRRLVFFGRLAGLAGMLDSLWALGQRLQSEGVQTPLSQIKTATEYGGLAAAKAALEQIKGELGKAALPLQFTPLVVGITGDGNVGRGALEIVEHLGSRELKPTDLLAGPKALPQGPGLHHVIFREPDMVQLRAGEAGTFELQDYYQRPERYEGVFEQYLPCLNLLANCIYWEERYPRLVTTEGLRKLYDAASVRLKAIGDISCDVQGSIEVTVKETKADNPVYVYDLKSNEAIDGVQGAGPVIMAVSNLPSELPREASEEFSAALLPFVGPLAAADVDVAFERWDPPAEVKRGTIVYRGELTPNYRYLQQYL